MPATLERAGRQRLDEVFEPRVDWQVRDLSESDLSESDISEKVNNKHILGVVSGQFFAPDGESRNGRFYPRSLWEKVLKNSETNNRLGEKTMFGTIGHDDSPVTEEQLREGMVSHIVSRLWIDESGRGMGEAIILDTQAGRNLNTYLRAGSRLSTSSRASGRYVEGKQRNGIPIVDEDAYVFETFDFVIEPGFTEARPELMESLTKKEIVMSDGSTDAGLMKQAMAELSESRKSLQVQLNEKVHENGQLSAQLKEATERLKVLESKQDLFGVAEKLNVSNEDIARVPRIFEDLGFKGFSDMVRFMEALDSKDLDAIRQGGLSEKFQLLQEFQEKIAPTPEKALEIGEKVASCLKDYKVLGEARDLRMKLREARETQAKVQRLGGDLDKIEETMKKSSALLEKFSQLGSYTEIKEALEASLVVLEDYRAIGTPRSIKEALTKANGALSVVKKMGGLKRIAETVKRYNSLVRKMREEKTSTLAEQLSSEFNTHVDTVRGLVEKLGGEEARKVLMATVKNRRVSESAPADDKTPNRLHENRGLIGSVFNSALRG